MARRKPVTTKEGVSAVTAPADPTLTAVATVLEAVAEPLPTPTTLTPTITVSAGITRIDH